MFCYGSLHIFLLKKSIVIVKAVLRIHDTFWCGAGSDPGPAFFVTDLQDANKQFFSKFFFLFLIEDTFTSFFKDKKSKRSHKQ